MAPTTAFYICAAAILISGSTYGAEADTAKNRYSSFPPITNIESGVSWPAGQALPIFATPADRLDAIAVQTLTIDEQIAFAALQGYVNRQQPRIYLQNARADEGRDTWAQTSTVALGPLNVFDYRDKYDLLAKYADEVDGLLLYDPSRSPHLRNLASTVAGLNRLLPVTAAMQQQIKRHGIELKVALDLTNLPLSSPLEVYEHLYDHYWEKCEKRLLVSARPSRGGDFHHTRDMAAACGAAVVWLDCRVPDERSLLEKFFGDMTAGKAIVLGWYATERSGITTASQFGIGTMPADHYVSSTLFSGGDHRIQIPPVPPKPTLANKAYIAIFISDGDNIQYTQHALRKIWDASASSRGQIPLNWTIAPGLVDIGPGILNYYYTTATPQDCFVAGPSGMGYAIPFNTLIEPGAAVGEYLTDPVRLDGYTSLTETYLQRAGLRAVTIWDNATPAQRASYAQNCRQLYGATVQNFKDVPSVAGSVEENRLPFDKLVIPYAGTYAHISRSLRSELKKWDGDAPFFLSYQVDIWGEMRPAKLVELAQQLNRQFPDKIEFVRADHYFNLYNETHHLPFNLAMSPRTKISAGHAADQAKLAIDGTPATLWNCNNLDAAWLQLDFGAPYRVSRYVIRHAGANGLQQQNTRAYTMQASLDGAQWSTIDAYQDNVENVTDVQIQPVLTRYLRVTIDEPGANGEASIADIEVYGSRLP
ncbi:discoidin domain-containing protein [Blastopirellula sp. J2-11]|uniref:discoidin domain-containing protein n=1 Tax=Blastopirellula sp. J2-11 TaxID=2943192 RepID=UPI0021C9E726|nr:discoidin domain-containing protein [Blastopirellula sp. J2-11]UUO09310.1 discoidin domain-containing protein [Blastopirellula sp. J2-11]